MSEGGPIGDSALVILEFPLDVVEARLDGEWRALARGPDPYNLLDFSGDPTPVSLTELRASDARLAHDELPLGAIDRLRLTLSRDEPFVLVGLDGIEHPVDVPEEALAGLDLPVTLVIDQQEAAVVTLAVDVWSSLAPAEAGGGYVFVPQLVVVE